MAVNKKAKKIYNDIFEGVELTCTNLITIISEKLYLKKYLTKEPIPQQFKIDYTNYWKSFFSRRMIREGIKFAWYYASKNGNYDPRYLPNTFYFTKVDQHFNNRKLGWGFNDKNYYSKIFYDIKQPKTIVRKIDSQLLNAEYECIDVNTALDLIKSENEVVCKPTLESGSGRDIRFWNLSDEKEILEFLKDKHQKDYIVQKIVKQHECLEKIHKESLNTIRICSLLKEGEVFILSSCLRMGVGTAKVDNFSAGGLSVGIDEKGFLKKYAFECFHGEKYIKHPQSITFEGYKIASFDKAINLVKKAHQIIPHFRLVSWDIAIDENGDAILIEPNMRKGGIRIHQFCNGPLFGDLTDDVMNEILKG